MRDSSWGDTEDHKSTGCYMILFQGGLIDHSSFVPNIVAMSSAEAEICAMCVGAMATCHFRQVYCDIMFDDPSRPYTVPILSDSKSGIISCGNDRDTKQTRHIDRRMYAIRLLIQHALVTLIFIPGDKYNVADLGTKNLSSPANSYKLSIIEIRPLGGLLS